MTRQEINKIKDEATQKAVEILAEKYNVDDIKTEGYNEAIDDAQKYFILCGCKVLSEEFGFGYKRLEKFLSKLANLEVDVADGTTAIEVLESWLDKDIGLRLEKEEIDDAIERRKGNDKQNRM